jgi:hypothetical protein
MPIRSQLFLEKIGAIFFSHNGHHSPIVQQLMWQKYMFIYFLQTGCPYGVFALQKKMFYAKIALFMPRSGYPFVAPGNKYFFAP